MRLGGVIEAAQTEESEMRIAVAAGARNHYGVKSFGQLDEKLVAGNRALLCESVVEKFRR